MENVMRVDAGWSGDDPSCEPPVVPAGDQTAIYVGRAFFRMTRVMDDGTDTAADLGAQPDVGLIGETEEHVVLTPPPMTVVVADQYGSEAAANAEAATDAEAADAADAMVPDLKELLPVPTGMRVLQRRIPMWPVVGALIAGVCVTLSAQAVMRRSPRASLANATAALAATFSDRGTPARQVLPAKVMALAESGPLVAPSTATGTTTAIAWSPTARINPEPRRTNRIQPPINAAGRTPRALAARVVVNNRRGTTWVDPFAANKLAHRISVKSGAKAGPRLVPDHEIRVNVQPAHNTVWVDPFAN